ncbi:hypothetical protein KKC59_01420 [bacterium]|nr:hypothetical protein [bacterium]
MAEGLMKSVCGHNFAVASAGVLAFSGLPASENTQQVMRENNIDISRHKSKLLTEEMVSSYDLIVVMEQTHKDIILRDFSVDEDKIYLLKQFENGKIEETIDPINDPFGGGLDEYKKCFDEIKKCINGLNSLIK